MRQTTAPIGQVGTAAIEYPNRIAFMYSRQPVIITHSMGAGSIWNKMKLTVTCDSNQRTHQETREIYGTRAEFDLSRIMQLLAPDVDTLLNRLNHLNNRSLTETFSFTLRIETEKGSSVQIFESKSDIVALYGTLDQGETYGTHTQRRLWLNFPQTFNLWKDEEGSAAFVFDGKYIYPEVGKGGPCQECDLVATLKSHDDTASLAKLLPERPVHNVGLTWKARIEHGAETEVPQKLITLVPDDSKEGTYLRWLNRRGEISYWLFKNSQLRVTSAINSNFSRYYDGDPNTPNAGVYNNSQKTDYREAREMALGALGLSRDEYDDLCDLATSPLIERLLPNVDDGSGAPQHIWQRVNVAAGTFARNIKRNTPNMQDLEFIIELPERNTIKL